jgi:hypothetical protein
MLIIRKFLDEFLIAPFNLLIFLKKPLVTRHQFQPSLIFPSQFLLQPDILPPDLLQIRPRLFSRRDILLEGGHSPGHDPSQAHQPEYFLVDGLPLFLQLAD